MAETYYFITTDNNGEICIGETWSLAKIQWLEVWGMQSKYILLETEIAV
jgi:hypothetical protein